MYEGYDKAVKVARFCVAPGIALGMTLIFIELWTLYFYTSV